MKKLPYFSAHYELGNYNAEGSSSSENLKRADKTTFLTLIRGDEINYTVKAGEEKLKNKAKLLSSKII
jgi:hypothetical protein